MRVVMLTVALGVIIGGLGTQTAHAQSVAKQCPGIVRGIAFYQNATWKYQDALNESHTRSSFRPHRILSCRYAGEYVGSLWRKRARAWRKRYEAYIKEQRTLFSRLYAKWSCIHRYEGSWMANTGNGYYGGLQMDLTFQRHYGAKFLARYGTADNWPVIDQLIAAEKAYWSGRGFYPWPRTARACGLI